MVVPVLRLVTGPVGVDAALVNAQVLEDLIHRDDRAFSFGIGQCQLLPEVQQQDGIQESELGAAEQQRSFQIAGVELARECDLEVSVNHQVEKELRQAAANQHLITHQDRPEFGVAASIERRAGQ